MRHFLSLWVLCVGLCLPTLAIAQEDAAKTEQSQPSEQEKSDKEDAPATDDKAAEPDAFDSEEYFKRGEDNIYKGSNCAPPPDLIT